MEREFGVRIKPAESFYGSLAKTFLEMLTTLRQMLRRTFWCLRVLPQVSRRLLWRLRVLPQVSRQMPGRRESRKSAFLHFGAYKTVASISKGTLAITTCYQRHSLWIRESHSFVELTLWTVSERLPDRASDLFLAPNEARASERQSLFISTIRKRNPLWNTRTIRWTTTVHRRRGIGHAM